MTRAALRAMVDAQGNACAICAEPFADAGAVVIDHDHACCRRPRGKKGNNAVFCGKCSRGWLCYLCNRWAIGALEYMEKVNIPAEKALAYLAKWRKIIKERGGYEPKEEAPKRKPSR